MRIYLIILLALLLTTGLVAQEQQYVWAQSGLSLRAAGSAAGNRIMTIPYGAKVQLTGEVGEVADVQGLSARQFAAETEETSAALYSEEYVMQGRFVEIRYGERTGFIYDAFLFSIPPPRADNQDFWLPEWLNNFAGPGVTIRNYPGKKDTETIVYPGGIVFARSQASGSRTFSLSIPHASMAQGYVIVDRFWDVERAIRNFDESEDNGEDYWYTILKRDTGGNLYFENGAGRISVRKTGDFLVLSFVDRW